MTNLTPEQIREAVELAEGWYIADEVIVTPSNTHYLGTEPECIAALASQLISQVDAMGHYLAASPLSKDEGGTGTDWWCCVNERGTHKSFGPGTDGGNRDDNSILACTEFLRGR